MTIIANLQVCSIIVALILQIAMRMLSAFYYLTFVCSSKLCLALSNALSVCRNVHAKQNWPLKLVVRKKTTRLFAFFRAYVSRA